MAGDHRPQCGLCPTPAFHSPAASFCLGKTPPPAAGRSGRGVGLPAKLLGHICARPGVAGVPADGGDVAVPYRLRQLTRLEKQNLYIGPQTVAAAPRAFPGDGDEARRGERWPQGDDGLSHLQLPGYGHGPLQRLLAELLDVSPLRSPHALHPPGVHVPRKCLLALQGPPRKKRPKTRPKPLPSTDPTTAMFASRILPSPPRRSFGTRSSTGDRGLAGMLSPAGGGDDAGVLPNPRGDAGDPHNGGERPPTLLPPLLSG
ncbi:uncharacterized protein LOC115337727 isoform X5 [Aquila chrysaetos chrysaetos]|nr:uncharacterized protein LOC115337727 isoform X4 [Aquila chrysaetos chrysaetos]XP_040977688.1 uncharacterized protein LOC115337727 isoform X5 [Aquila chrysaetos chrysaetos]